MNELPAARLGATVGLALAAALALWWLGSTRLALDQGADAGRAAGDALHALALVRDMAVALLCPRVAAVHGWRAGAAAGLGMVAPSWPLLVLAWSASAVPAARLALAEALLLALALALPLLGQGLRRALQRTDFTAGKARCHAEAIGTAAGALLAAALWLARGLGQWPPF
jgi:hypothetical protein